MFTLWSDFDRAFFGNPWRARDRQSQALSRRFERLLDEAATLGQGASWQRINLLDKGDNFEFVVELPGVSENELDITVHGDVLTVRASRKLEKPEGLVGHRLERSSYEFQRSLSLPATVDAEQSKATLKDGILRVTMAKAAEHKPRQISVKSV